MMETSILTKIIFLAYIVAVFVLAGLSHRLLAGRSFLSEYFLGSRSLGTWTLAFTFAATSASGGSFGGYPSLIYSYGWVLALWISSYMIFPLTTMGILGKRINQVARISGAITVPDVLRDRYGSPAIGVFSSLTIIFFNVVYLVAQFKLGAIIIQDTLGLERLLGLSVTWGYNLALLIFAVTVVFYTTYGGFRAVVWTDVLQGVVMVSGIVLLVPVVWQLSGGMERATHELLSRPGRVVTAVPGPAGGKGEYNDLAFQWVESEPGIRPPRGIVYRTSGEPNQVLRWELEQPDPATQWLVVHMQTDAAGEVTTTGNDLRRLFEQDDQWSGRMRIEPTFRNDQLQWDGQAWQHLGATGVIGFPAGAEHRFAFVDGADLVLGPGKRNDGSPFHPLGMVVSFFFMWAIVGIGQPSNMLRMMAFRDSRTLKRAILMVTAFFGLVYLPLVFIVMSARSLLPVLNTEESDRTIVLVATRLVAEQGFWYQVLGAILVAAPFAAVMSTVDSFLLMISSSAVRDVYQRSINPRVSQTTVRRASYLVTLGVGVLATALAFNPPHFLQRIIIFASGGFAATFLFPTLLGLYWSRATREGALASMVGGFAIVLVLSLPNLWGGSSILLLGLDPAVWGLLGSCTLHLGVSGMTGRPPQSLVERYFPTADERRDGG